MFGGKTFSFREIVLCKKRIPKGKLTKLDSAIKISPFYGQIILGCTGILGNCLAIPVLISKRLNSIFNKILVIGENNLEFRENSKTLIFFS